MPKFLPPIRNGPHRIAAIALYRALLTQCRALTLAIHQRDELQNVIRNRFKQARHSHSTQRLRISFQAGYEAIDQLDAAVAGDEGSIRYVSHLLERAPPRTKLPPPLPTVKLASKADKVGAAQNDGIAEQPKTSIFDRPLPLEKLSGPRHVPVLFSANRIPVLRLKKPQPASLSRYLDQRIKQRHSRHDRRWRLTAEEEIAAREDEWDDIVGADAPKEEVQSQSLAQAMLSRPGSTSAEPSWTSEVHAAISEVKAKLNEEREKNRIMAGKMQAIVDREKELFEKEKADRYRIKRREYRYRRRQKAKDEADSSEQEDDRAALLANLTSPG